MQEKYTSLAQARQARLHAERSTSGHQPLLKEEDSTIWIWATILMRSGKRIWTSLGRELERGHSAHPFLLADAFLGPPLLPDVQQPAPMGFDALRAAKLCKSRRFTLHSNCAASADRSSMSASTVVWSGLFRLGHPGPCGFVLGTQVILSLFCSGCRGLACAIMGLIV